MNFDWLKQTYYFISNLQNIDKNIEFLLWHTLFIMIKKSEKERSELWKQKSADGIVLDGIGELMNCIMDEFDADVIYTESDEIERLSTTQSLVDITVPDPVIVRGAGTTTLWVHLLASWQWQS